MAFLTISVLSSSTMCMIYLVNNTDKAINVWKLWAKFLRTTG